jgi:hypothetical protein
MMAKQQSPRQTITTGPGKGVLDSEDPFDDTKDGLLFWQDAVNVFIPDPGRGSGTYQRPAFALMNPSNQLGGANHQGQGVFHHTAADGTEYNFKAVSGRLYRSSADETAQTDVTPAGITISGALGTRVFMLSFADKLIVSDGVNRPWYGTNLSSTPITGTQIQFDIGNSLWNAQHMTEYSGALVFVLKTVAGVFQQSTIAWSAPNDPTQGYFNVVAGISVDYTWILTQTGSTPLYAIWGTNMALLYWRDDSMGGLTGPIGPNFENSSTHDAIDFKIGTRSPASIAQIGSSIFFADTEGRPQLYRVGNPLEPLWLQMRTVVDQSRTDAPSSTAVTACSAILPALSLWIVALWSPVPATNLCPNMAFAFDVKTGTYVGRWIIGPGVNIEAMGLLKDQNGASELVVIGSLVAAGANGFGGYVWRLTDVHENVWLDSGITSPNVAVQTQRLAYGTDVMWNADQVRAVVGTQSPVQLQIITPSMVAIGFESDGWATLLGEPWTTLDAQAWTTIDAIPATATPSPSLDETYRCAWGTDAMGRGFELTLIPTDPTTQWRLDRVTIDCMAMAADPAEA